MILLDNLSLGFSIAVQQQNLLLLGGGCVLGSLAAALPGLGVLSLIALALPVAWVLDPTPAMVLLVGIYCGGGGPARSLRRSAIGDAAARPSGGHGSVEQAVRLFAGSAPLLMLIASLIGALAIVAAAPWLIEWTFRFGPAEYFSMMVLGLLAVVVLAVGSLVKSLSMLVLGMLLAQIGSDPASGAARFDLGFLPMEDGIGFIPMALGLVVVGRIVSDLLGMTAQDAAAAQPPPLRLAARAQLQRHGLETVRGSAVGSLLGAVPGGGIVMGAFLASVVERRLRSATAAEPTTAAQAALVAGVRSSFIPGLALGVPTNAALALMIGLMSQHGVSVGPQMMTGQADLFWGLVVAVALSGVVLFVLSRPLAMLVRRFETVRYELLYPVLGAFCCIAAYALPGGVSAVGQMAVFGLLGHLLFKLGCPLAPLLFGFILGPTLEASLRHALELSAGDWSILLTRPISAGLLLAGAMLVSVLLLPSVRPRRAALFDHER